MGDPHPNPADENERASVAADDFLNSCISSRLPPAAASAALWARIEAEEAKEANP